MNRPVLPRLFLSCRKSFGDAGGPLPKKKGELMHIHKIIAEFSSNPVLSLRFTYPEPRVRHCSGEETDMI